MKTALAGPRHWATVLLVALGLVALYAGAVRAPFLNDDYLFLEEARSRGLASSLSDLGPLGNYYRPLSRQIYFAALAPIAGGHPAVFHAFNFALFLGALALLADLLRSALPRSGVLAGVLYFALIPFQRVNLMWISCSQDLLALAGSLGAFALFRRGRMIAALACFAAALASKESALALPAALVAWDRWIDRRAWPETLRRVTPFGVAALVWVVVSLVMRARHAAAAPLDLSLPAFAAAFAHSVQSLLGLDHPAGWMSSLATHGPELLPLLCFATAAFLIGEDGKPPRGPSGTLAAHPASLTEASARSAIRGYAGLRLTGGASRRFAAFACLWLVAFTIPTGPVSYAWSSYYYTLAAVGAAILVGIACARADRWVLLGLAAGLVWWHAAGAGTRAFSIAQSRWSWTSHLTSFYFERAAAHTDTLSRQLVRLVPDPEPETRFFFVTLPSWAGFQMGNGALIRSLYRDPTLASHFYTRFSDSTAADHPCRFVWWDGRELQMLYAGTADPWFQVGADLLLLDRPAGAAHAFRRGIAAGGERMDHLYWLGWAELWRDRREDAEAAWTAFGARDDSVYWRLHVAAAHNALSQTDTLAARRHLMRAIEHGVGRPEPHSILGELLMASSPKYGLMELKVAVWLDPGDGAARRLLALGLDRAGIEDAARRELERLIADFPRLRSDSTVARAWKRHEPRPRAVVTETRGGRP